MTRAADRWVPTPLTPRLQKMLGNTHAYQLHRIETLPSSGCVCVHFSDEAVGAAQERMARWNGESENTRVWTGAIWSGEVAEDAFGQWLTAVGVEHRRGEHYGAHDFQVAGHSIEVKARAFQRWQPSRHVLFPIQHEHRLRERGGLFFAAVETLSPVHVLLLGGISTAQFLEDAHVVHAGNKLDGGAGPVATNTCYELPFGRLMSPANWLLDTAT